MSDTNAARVAADNLGLAMLERIVDQFRQMPGFDNLTQAQQQVHIDRLDKIVRQLIAEALNVIFRAEYPACVADLVRIVVGGKTIVGRFDVIRTAESRHELMDRSGQKVVIVMADPDTYYARMAQVKAAQDQGDLFHDPSQPLGHMGVSEPPKPPDSPGDASAVFEEGDNGLEDTLPASDEATPVDMITPELIVERLAAFDIRVGLETANAWTREQLEEAAVWAIAAQNAVDDPRLPQPEVPAFLRAHIVIPEVQVGEGAGAGSATASDSPPSPAGLEPIEIPDAAIDAEIVAALALRGIKVKARIVREWSKSQRVAAVSWLQSRSPHRPEFIPPPAEKDA